MLCYNIAILTLPTSRTQLLAMLFSTFNDIGKARVHNDMNNLHNANLGATNIQKTRRNLDPMRSYDALPVELRRWLMDACLPWSPTSSLQIWRKARSSGASPSEVIARLCRIENAMLARGPNSFSTTSLPTIGTG